MMVFSAAQMLSALLGYCILGALSGAFYPSIDALLRCIKRLILLPIDAWKKEKKRIIKSDILGQKINSARVSRNVYDFVYTLSVGVAYIVVTYVFFDSVFRGYFLLLFFLCFFISKKTAGRFLGSFIASFTAVAYAVAYRMIYPLLLPIRALVLLARRIFAPPLRLLLNLYIRIRAGVVRKRKLRRAEGALYCAAFK